jgi:opacity protein-like surface antigen
MNMKSKMIYRLLAGIFVLIATETIAATEGSSYITVQYGYGDYDEDGITETFNPTALVGRFGYFFHPAFSIEARLGLGLQDDTQFVSSIGLNGIDARLDLDHIVGLYGTGHINLTDSISFYGVLGASSVKATASIPSIPALTASDDESSVSYGVGADVGISKNIALNIEYMRYLEKSNYDFDMIGLGATFSF